MNTEKHLVAVAILAALVFQTGCTGSGERLPDIAKGLDSPPSLDRSSGVYRRSAYAALGAGVSRLDPNTDEVEGSGVNDRINNGAQLTVGADLTRYFSAELYASDLGDAGVSPDTSISYTMAGISGLVYAGKNRSRYRRQGLSAYGRLGFGYMSNSSSGSVPYRTKNESSLVVGAGVEYGTRIGLGFRGEVISFDEDALYGQLGMVYRFGRTPARRVPEVAQAAEPIVPVPAVQVAPEPEKDADADGVPIPTDQCLSTPPNAAVDQVGCSILAGVAVGVNFHSGSDQLTLDAKIALDQVVSKMLQYPQLSVEVTAHTDSQGSAVLNQVLSEQRAVAVVEYLISGGIPAKKLSTKALGESQPVATNDTADGRAKNRRVELFARKVLVTR